MADDDDQRASFQSPESGAAAAAAAALAALVSGAILRAQEVLALADELGQFETEVESSCIETLGYNVGTGLLTVSFLDGSQYQIPTVSMWNFLRFLNAPSKGGFWNSEVRGRWAPYSHLSEGTKGAKR